MGPEALFVLLGAIASVAAVVVAYAAFRYSARKDRNQADTDAIRVMIDQALAPLKDTLAKSSERTSILETQMDIVMIGVKKDMAKVIHSPDPRRAHIDYLMDKIVNDEPMSADEESETRRVLKVIMMYEPGHSPDPGFPVKDGEQAAAAWLLRTLDYVPIHSGGRI